MRVGILGDLQSAVPVDVCAAVAAYQIEQNFPLDLLLQVGDLWRRLWEEAPLQLAAERFRGILPLPIRFLRGNHDDPDRIRSVLRERRPGATVDTPGMFAYLEDGTRMDAGGLRFGVAGGAASPSPDPGPDDVDPEALRTLAASGPVDVLLTHDAPVGFSWPRPDGFEPGSRLIADYALGPAGPALLVHGHQHVAYGPKRLGASRLQIAGLAAADGPVTNGWLGLLDTTARAFWIAGREDNRITF